MSSKSQFPFSKNNHIVEAHQESEHSFERSGGGCAKHPQLHRCIRASVHFIYQNRLPWKLFLFTQLRKQSQQRRHHHGKIFESRRSYPSYRVQPARGFKMPFNLPVHLWFTSDYMLHSNNKACTLWVINSFSRIRASDWVVSKKVCHQCVCVCNLTTLLNQNIHCDSWCLIIGLVKLS